MMRVGVLIPGFSSDERDWAIPVQLNLAREQAKHLDLRVIALRYPHRRDRYNIHGADVSSLGYGAGARGLRRLTLWADALRLLHRLHAEKPFDVLHAMWADETGLIAGWFGRMQNIPVVVSILGGELVSLPGIGYGGQRSAFGRWITGSALAGADKIHVISGTVRDLLQRMYPQVELKTVHIPLGVNENLFTPAADFQPRHLISVGSLIPVKDQSTLLKALARLTNVTLDLIGEGSSRPQIEAQIAALGLSDRVRVLGNIPHEELPAHYQTAALHVLTSRHETFAMSVVEAAACAVPSVTTHVGMLPDYPALGETVAIGDDFALAATIRRLLDDPARLAALRQSARAMVEGKLTIENMAARLRGLYRARVEGRR